jgi:hypothetical protein
MMKHARMLLSKFFVRMTQAGTAFPGLFPGTDITDTLPLQRNFWSFCVFQNIFFFNKTSTAYDHTNTNIAWERHCEWKVLDGWYTSYMTHQVDWSSCNTVDLYFGDALY